MKIATWILWHGDALQVAIIFFGPTGNEYVNGCDEPE
jgi:hypothetical protein